MSVILTINYQKLLCPEEVLEFLPFMNILEEKYIGNKKVYFIKEDQCIEAKVIPRDRIVAEGTEKAEQSYKEMYNEMDKAYNEYQSKLWAEQEKTKELTAKVKTLEALCPVSHTKEGE